MSITVGSVMGGVELSGGLSVNLHWTLTLDLNGNFNVSGVPVLCRILSPCTRIVCADRRETRWLLQVVVVGVSVIGRGGIASRSFLVVVGQPPRATFSRIGSKSWIGCIVWDVRVGGMGRMGAIVSG